MPKDVGAGTAAAGVVVLRYALLAAPIVTLLYTKAVLIPFKVDLYTNRWRYAALGT